MEGASKQLEDGSLEFQHDQRLKWSSALFLSKEHVMQIYGDVAASPTKVCVLTARDGMPFDAASLATSRELLQPEVFSALPRSHHFHMDPDSAEGVSKVIMDFLSA